MALSGPMDTAAQGPTLRACCAVQIVLPANTINLLDASAVATFSVNGTSTAFSGLDPTFGAVMSISAIEEAVAASAPNVQITLAPPTPSAVALISALNAQGSTVYVWYVFINEALGTVIGTPELLFYGYLDTVKTTSDANSRTCVLDISSEFERLFVPSEGARLNDIAHQATWPGEDGLSQAVNSTVVDPIWGAIATQPTTTPGQFTPGASTTGGGSVNFGALGGPFS
jgi:hypothetical protein